MYGHTGRQKPFDINKQSSGWNSIGWVYVVRGARQCSLFKLVEQFYLRTKLLFLMSESESDFLGAPSRVTQKRLLNVSYMHMQTVRKRANKAYNVRSKCNSWIGFVFACFTIVKVLTIYIIFCRVKEHMLMYSCARMCRLVNQWCTSTCSFLCTTVIMNDASFLNEVSRSARYMYTDVCLRYNSHEFLLWVAVAEVAGRFFKFLHSSSAAVKNRQWLPMNRLM